MVEVLTGLLVAFVAAVIGAVLTVMVVNLALFLRLRARIPQQPMPDVPDGSGR
ncbi:hypothetical protein [Mycolicibacterium sp.]